MIIHAMSDGPPLEHIIMYIPPTPDDYCVLLVTWIRNISLLFHILIPRAGIVFGTANIVKAMVPVCQRVCMII